jgi:hypothetical protein
VRFLEGCFLNPWVRNRPQRAFHTPGIHKFWSIEHSLKVLDGHSRQVFAYLWYLTMFWFGTCRDWSQDPLEYLPSSEAHLLEDLVTFLPQIAQVRPTVRADWERVSSVMLHRLLEPVAPGSHQKLAEIENIIDLIRGNPRIRRCVEMEGDEGTTGLALGLRFLNRDLDVFSIESFLDERQRPPIQARVPSRLNFQQNLAQFPSARVKLIAGVPKLAASSFADGSVDLVVANGSQRVSYLRELLAAWRPKVSRSGFIAISGLRGGSRCTAIDSIFRQAHFKKGGAFWWKKS